MTDPLNVYGIDKREAISTIIITLEKDTVTHISKRSIQRKDRVRERKMETDGCV